MFVDLVWFVVTFARPYLISSDFKRANIQTNIHKYTAFLFNNVLADRILFCVVSITHQQPLLWKRKPAFKRSQNRVPSIKPKIVTSYSLFTSSSREQCLENWARSECHNFQWKCLVLEISRVLARGISKLVLVRCVYGQMKEQNLVAGVRTQRKRGRRRRRIRVYDVDRERERKKDRENSGMRKREKREAK